MKILLIDAGNTTIDFRSYEPKDKQLVKLYRPLTQTLKEWTPKSLKKALNWEENQFSEIVVSSVVPLFNSWIEKFGQANQIPILNIKESKKINPKAFSKISFKEVGADFIANFHAQKWTDALIISLGTATTIAQIRNGIFQGAIIIPGIRTSLANLINSAALLKDEKFSWTSEKIGTTTINAISLGTINGHYYALKSFIDQLRNQQTQVVFTGGNADLILPGITKDGFEYDEELIFKGIINLI